MLPGYLDRKPEKRDETKFGLAERLRTEVASQQSFSEVMKELRLPCSGWRLDEVQEFEAAGKFGLQRSQQKRNHGKMQDFREYNMYFTPSLWIKLQSCKDDYSIAICLAGFLAKLGLRVASELTIAYVVAGVLALSPLDHSSDSASDLHTMFVAMKKLVRCVVSRATEPMSQPPWVIVLPRDTSKHNEGWLKEALGTELVMSPPPISSDRLAALAARVPCRETHKDIRATVADRKEQCASGSTESSALKTIGNIFKEALQVVAQTHNTKETQGAIKRLTSPPKHFVEVAGAGPVQPMNLLNQFEREAKTVADKSTTDTSGLEIAQQLANAVQDAKQSDGSVKQMKRPAAALECKADSASNADEEVASLSQEKDQIAKKRPASKKEKPMKKPAAKQMKKPAAKVKGKATDSQIFLPIKDDRGNVLITAAYRRKWYALGCGKCRGRKGCTPSCFKGRKEI